MKKKQEVVWPIFYFRFSTVHNRMDVLFFAFLLLA